MSTPIDKDSLHGNPLSSAAVVHSPTFPAIATSSTRPHKMAEIELQSDQEHQQDQPDLAQNTEGRAHRRTETRAETGPERSGQIGTVQELCRPRSPRIPEAGRDSGRSRQRDEPPQ